MIQFVTLMWFLGLFFGIIGFLRGWNRELVVMAGIVVTMFALFQFDGFLRGSILLQTPPGQIFLIQAALFIIMVVILYQAEDLAGTQSRRDDDYQSGLLGALLGFVNGYLIGGTLWYFLDINEYPLTDWAIAPGADSASAASVNLMPIVLLSGGTSGTGDILAVMVLVLLFVVFISL